MINNRLSDDIDLLLDQYFKDLHGELPGNLYDLVLTHIEAAFTLRDELRSWQPK